MPLDLSAMDVRILGCLVEKEMTTPDNYPLSTNALVNACNQKTNREPVVDYDERSVDAALLDMRTLRGLVRTVTSGRTNKHRHVLDEAWGLSPRELSVLAVLMLRGDQTVGELRTRTERMVDFDSLEAVEGVLDALAARGEPFVTHLDRQPGQKERRWRELVSDQDAVGAAQLVASNDLDAATPAGPAAPAASSPRGEVAALRAEVDHLRADVDRLYELLGESPE